MLSARRVLLAATALWCGGLLCEAQTPAGAPFLPDTKDRAASPTPAKNGPVTDEMRGDIFMARKMYREAAEAYLDIQPATAITLNKTGIAYHQMMNLDQARKYYEKAGRADPKYAEAVNNLGTIYYAKKSYRRAVTQYNKALRLAPLSASIHSNLGTAQFARKKYELAAASYQKALELDPDVFEHRSANGVLLQERNVEERAKFHYQLAKVYAKRGMNERALVYVRKSLEEGFKERKRFEEEPEFAALREMPEFQQLLASGPRVL